MSLVPHIVFGPLRAGTTLFRLMLDAHPDLSCPDESDFLFDYLRPDEGWLYDKAGLHRNRIFRASGIVFPEGLDGIAALHDMIAQIQKSGGHPVLMLHRNMELAAAIFPEARVIQLKRDPRDVARSAIGMGWGGNIFYGVDSWCHSYESWERGAGALRVASLEVFYEELVRRPDQELVRVAAHLGISYDPVMLSYSNDTSYDAPDAALVSQWHRKLSRREVQLVEAKIGDRLERYGYEPSGHPAIEVGLGDRLLLWFDSKARNFRFRVRRYGVMNVLLNAFARRLHLSPLHNVIKMRLDEIDSRYLK